MTGTQLTFDELEWLIGLREPRRVPVSDGGERLLRALVEHGLSEPALLPAAALVAVLEESAVRHSGRSIR